MNYKFFHRTRVNDRSNTRVSIPRAPPPYLVERSKLAETRAQEFERQGKRGAADRGTAQGGIQYAF
jgi:hypothetical protein